MKNINSVVIPFEFNRQRKKGNNDKEQMAKLFDKIQIIYTEQYVAVYKRKDRMVELFKYKGYRPAYLDMSEAEI